MPRKQTETVQLKLRFPEKLRARIEAAAKKSDQSMNAEIVRRLEQSFEKVDREELIQSTATTTATLVISKLWPRVEFSAPEKPDPGKLPPNNRNKKP